MSDPLAGDALAHRTRLVLAVPLNVALGTRLRSAADPSLGAAFEVAQLADNGAGGAHAAAISTILELAGYLALMPQLGVDEHAITHAMSMQLVAAARGGETVEASGVVDRRTRRLAFVSAVATVGDRVVARAQFTKSVVPFA